MLWIIIAVVAVLVLWVISVQNKLVKSDEFCNNALKQINVQQISRYDALQQPAQVGIILLLPFAVHPGPPGAVR